MSIYKILMNYFSDLISEHNLDDEEIFVSIKSLTEKEAIGITERKDFPLLNGKEVLIEANFKNSLGQAFTNSRSALSIKLSNVRDLDIENNDYDIAIFISILNSVMKHLGLISNTVHCKNEEPELCAEQIANFLNADLYKNILLIGYQPAFIDKLSSAGYNLRVLDLNVDNIGEIRYGIKIEDGNLFKEAISWANIILCTGSTIGNRSIMNFLNLENKEVYFYGTTIAGPSKILNLKRLCFMSN